MKRLMVALAVTVATALGMEAGAEEIGSEGALRGATFDLSGFVLESGGGISVAPLPLVGASYCALNRHGFGAELGAHLTLFPGVLADANVLATVPAQGQTRLILKAGLTGLVSPFGGVPGVTYGTGLWFGGQRSAVRLEYTARKAADLLTLHFVSIGVTVFGR
jgi:hypothetical protein